MRIRLLSFLPAALLLTTALAGCVVAPAPAPAPYAVQGGYAGPPAYAPPPGVVYVRPAYASPGPGYIWRYHRNYGWGYWHPHYGWHRGWAGY